MSALRRGMKVYESGVLVWAKWLPVLALGVYLLLLTKNIAVPVASTSSVDLHGLFGKNALFFLLICGPLFALPGGELAAGTVLLGTVLYLAFGEAIAQPIGPSILLGSLALIVALGDLMPWHQRHAQALWARKLRRFLTRCLIVGALVILLAALAQSQAFERWLTPALGFKVSKATCALLLALLLSAWLGLFLRVLPPAAIVLISLPTTIALSFVTGWPNYVLVVPLVYALGLSLTPLRH